MSFAILDSGALNSSITDEGLIVWAVFMAILADKDKDGITSLRPKQIAKIFNHPDVEEIQKAWDTLASQDPHSKNTEYQGRRIVQLSDGRWLVVSHEKYRSIHKQAVRQEQLRQAKARQREREKVEKEGGTYVPPTPEETAAVFEEETEEPKPKKKPKPPEHDPEIEALLDRGPAPLEPKDDKWL